MAVLNRNLIDNSSIHAGVGLGIGQDEVPFSMIEREDGSTLFGRMQRIEFLGTDVIVHVSSQRGVEIVRYESYPSDRLGRSSTSSIDAGRESEAPVSAVPKTRSARSTSSDAYAILTDRRVVRSSVSLQRDVFQSPASAHDSHALHH
jgi:hypothetical protein